MKPLLLLLLLCPASFTFSQQDPHFTMFWNTYNYFNPAFSGLTHQHFGTLNYRNQWDGYNGAPNTVLAAYATKVTKLHGGLGVNYMYDHIGYTDMHDANVNYSYHLEVGDSGTLAFGVSAGVGFLRMQSDWIPPTTIYDPLMPPNGKASSFNMNLGVMYKYRNLLIGISSTNVTEPILKHLNFTRARHYYLTGAYNFKLGSHFELKPQCILYSDAVVYAFDFNLMATYNHKFWFGFSYATAAPSAAIMAGFDIRGKFRIGYMYEETLNKLSSISRGSHEAVLGILIR
jgi:type IX secretion system PorP/SprF family membrane protein